MKLIGGFQANKIGGLTLDIVPRGGVIWSPATRWNVKALYGQAFRAPSINETTLNHPGLQGDVNLRPESVATFDVELSYHGDRIQGSANYFHSKHTDSIVIDASEVVWRYVSSGEATFQGMEFEGKYYVNRNLYVVGSLLHQSNHDGDGATNITPVPNTSGKGGISFQNERGITASVFNNYQGSMNGFSSILNPAPASRHLLSAHGRLDMAALFKASQTAGVAIVINADKPDERSGVAPRLGQQHRRHDSRAARTHHLHRRRDVRWTTDDDVASVSDELTGRPASDPQLPPC